MASRGNRESYRERTQDDRLETWRLAYRKKQQQLKQREQPPQYIRRLIISPHQLSIIMAEISVSFALQGLVSVLSAALVLKVGLFCAKCPR